MLLLCWWRQPPHSFLLICASVQHQLETSKKRRRGPEPVLGGFGAVTRALESLSVMPASIVSPPKLLATSATAVVTLEREPVYLQGRYLKFKRGLSQSPWVLEGVRMGESSVEEAIGDTALSFFRGASYKFHTAGREDVDVRMLGNGRPFILEVLDAKKANLTERDYAEIQDAVNAANAGAVEIRHTKESTKEYFAGLQAGADSKRKTYWCVQSADDTICCASQALWSHVSHTRMRLLPLLAVWFGPKLRSRLRLSPSSMRSTT